MATVHVHQRYLDSEERFEIFTVKAAERPHLLRWSPEAGHDHDVETSSDAETNEEKKTERYSDEDTEPPLPPPLTDGCDLPGWRSRGIAPSMNNSIRKKPCKIDVDYPFQGTLNVDAGSTFFRRESMFPFICSSVISEFDESMLRDDRRSCWWHSAKQKLNAPPPLERGAPVVHHGDVAVLVDYTTQKCNETRKVTLFSLEYEMKNRPVKILGATKGWTAMPDYNCNLSRSSGNDSTSEQRNAWTDNGEGSKLFSGGGMGGWTFATLVDRFGDVMFRFSDQHGEMMSLNTYAKYIINPEGLSDDSPLGIYDSEFGDDEVTKELLLEYSVPSCFSQDLFELMDDGKGEISSSGSEEEEQVKVPRPPYRWILIGPERSGTGMHIDPLWTNAWVTVLQGLKRWLLFPPDTPHDLIGMVHDKPQIPSSIWFHDFYDEVNSSSWPECYKPVEVLQHPGETVFVPAGWPHLVLNLKLTVAVTHNYAAEFGPFSKMWEDVAMEEPEFFLRWYSGLQKHGRSDLLLDGETCSE